MGNIKGRPKIGITMGDPAGIGPEVVIKACFNQRVRKGCVPIVFGSYEIIQNALRKFAKDKKAKRIESVTKCEKNPEVINVFDATLVDHRKIIIGEISRFSGKMATDSIICATGKALSNEIDAIVTAPLSKLGLTLAGYNFPGHTQLLAFLTKTKKYAMMFVGKKLNVILTTTHVPLSQVSSLIKRGLILEKIELADKFLKKYFKIPQPKIGVCGLNPHAGEDGILGKEEKKEIIPAIRSANRRGILTFGPFPSDSIFNPMVSNRFDCIVAMYHDQALIPFKMLRFGEAVNVTLGLPIIRTSPDHGTAIDIARKGIADPKGMVNAIEKACFFAKKIGNN